MRNNYLLGREFFESIDNNTETNIDNITDLISQNKSLNRSNFKDFYS